MSEKPLDLKQRVEALEAKVTIISMGLSDILTGLSGVGEAEKANAQAPWDPSKIRWTQSEGSKGSYERYPAANQKAESTPDYLALVADLKAHNRKLSKNGLFYWLFEDGATVGRKKRSY